MSVFIEFKLTEASSSLYPPLKNTTPAKAGGIVLDKAKTVLAAISFEVTFALSGNDKPGVTMFGFKRQPSQKILLSYKALTHAAKTLSVTFYETSILWVPSANISGSTIGTKPFA